MCKSINEINKVAIVPTIAVRSINGPCTCSNLRTLLKRRLFIVILLLFAGRALGADLRSIEFMDGDGIAQQHALAENSTITIRRPDHSIATGISYAEGILQTVQTHRIDGSIEIITLYRNGILQGVSTMRPDGSFEVTIVYKNGILTGLTTHRIDDSIAAYIDCTSGICQ